jgi:hypothetical protein
MAYIPPDAKWYLAHIVEQITVEGDPRYVVHTNMVLVRADSPDEAFAKAEELGKAGEISYENPDGKQVAITYRGLWDLNVIHNALEHGAEIGFDEDIETDEAAIDRYVSPKSELGVFEPIQPSHGPKYSSKDVIEKLREQFPDLDLKDLA